MNNAGPIVFEATLPEANWEAFFIAAAIPLFLGVAVYFIMAHLKRRGMI